MLEGQLSGRVLIAEDTPELQLLEKRILESIGLEVGVANNGQEAVDQLNSNQFDLVLMDMQMPVMDGIEATRMLREQGYTLPIIALTANVMEKHRNAFDEAGCDGFLGKPIDKNELRNLLGQYLREESINVQPIAEEEVDEELMAIFQESAATYKQQLRDALDQNDWQQVKEIAHPIKGSGTSFGFPVLTEKAKAVCDAYDNDQLDQLPQLTRILIDELDSMPG